MTCPIVVGTDLSDASDECLVQAEARATRDHSPLTVVHASSPLPWLNGDDSQDLGQLRRLIRERMKRLTGRPESSFSTLVESGLAHTVLTRIAVAQRALLVVGRCAASGGGHALLRDLAEQLLLHARGPLLVTRRRRGSGRLLVAVDAPFGHADELETARQEARIASCRLSVVHCIPRGVVEALTAEALEGCGHTATQLFGRQPRLTATYEALRAELVRRGIDAELHVAEGDPERLIPDLADKLGAELVVLGSSQRPARTSHVTLGVLRRLPCSALVAASSYVSLRPDPSDPSKPS